MRSAPSIGFEYRPSRWPGLVSLGMGALALAAVVLAGVPGLPAACLAMVTAVYVARVCRETARHDVHGVTWRVDGGWFLRLADDTDVEAHLEGARIVAGAIVLRLAWEPRGREALMLLPDNLDADTRRRLRMRLSALPDNG